MAEQEPLKKGLAVDDDTEPEYPVLHEHPVGTLAPLEFDGQVTAEHELVKKGLVVDAATDPA